jgi:hypothetical protein
VTNEFREFFIGLQLFDNSLNSQSLFNHKLCFTDSPKKMRVNYRDANIEVCANLVEDYPEFEKLAKYNLTVLYDFVRNKYKPLDCEQFACSLVRANHLSKICGSELIRQQGVLSEEDAG